MNLSHKLREQISNKVCDEMLAAWPSCINPDKMRSIIKEACMLALYDYIEFNMNAGLIKPEEFYESI